MNDKNKLFIKQNSRVLTEIFSEKLTELMREVLDNQQDRDKKVDAINILRTWLREIDMIEKGKEVKETTFI